uniref:Uncharacterized protein n=1 Tax=Setaria digitata TaxID=48799 RepID=A0A915PXG9_9BILA
MIGYYTILWTEKINEYGNLVAMEKFIIYHPQGGDYGGSEQFNEFIVELDLKRSILYTFNRLQRNLLSECSFDLLFRPSHLLPKWIEFDRVHCSQAWFESFAIDGQLMLFTESIRNLLLQESGTTSELYLTNLRIRNSSTQLLHLNFVSDIGVLRKQTYADLSLRNIPTFDDIRQLSTQNTQQLTTPNISSQNATSSNIPSPTTTGTTSFTITPVERTTPDGTDRFYSETNQSQTETDCINRTTDHNIREKETKISAGAAQTTLPLQYLTHHHWRTKDVPKDNSSNSEKLVRNKEETQDITLPKNTDNESIWQTKISDENIALDIEHQDDGDELEEKRGREKEPLQEVTLEEDTVMSGTPEHATPDTDHSGMISPSNNTPLKSRAHGICGVSADLVWRVVDRFYELLEKVMIGHHEAGSRTVLSKRYP